MPSRLNLMKEVTRWLRGLSSPNTRRAYCGDLLDFVEFSGIDTTKQFRYVDQEHVRRWIKHLKERGIGGSTIRRKLSALSSLFDKLAAEGVTGANPMKDVSRRPYSAGPNSRTIPLSDAQSAKLLQLPHGFDVQSARDRALLSLLVHHPLSRIQASSLNVADILDRRASFPRLRVQSRDGEPRRIPLHKGTHWELVAYLRQAGHGHDRSGPLFRPIRNNRTGVLDRPLSPDGIYKIVRGYLRASGVRGGTQTLRATAEANAATWMRAYSPRSSASN
jgi:site-specific recombinase XerD